jgi:uncharacterized protein
MPVESPVADHSGRRPGVARVRGIVLRPSLRVTVIGAVVVAVLIGAGCSDDATPVGDPTATVARTTPSTPDDAIETTSPSRTPDGFSTMTARITETDGQICEVCVWLADSPEERGLGLMGVTDLGGAAGMVFLFDEPVAGSFYMFQTPTPLSIAWFSPSGDHVGSADMAPCLDTPADECPLYSPGPEYDLALEVFEGGLADLGVGPGSRLELVEGTEADGCPLASPTP